VLSISQAHFDGLSSLIGNWNSGVAERSRAEAFLDGLRIEGHDSVELATARLLAADDEDDVAAAVLVLLECGEPDDAKPILDLLAEAKLEICDAIRRGLRLALIGKILDELQSLMTESSGIVRAIIADVLTFHRCKILIDLNELAKHAEPLGRQCAAEAAGRLQDPSNLAMVLAMIADPIPAVRRSALRAAARLSMPGLGDLCRTRAVADKPCLESIRFLAVCGTESDARLLMQLTRNETTAMSAVKAMGGVGAPILIPFLIDLLASPVLGDAAALALERTAFYSVPRGDAPEPPPDASEEVLDFWNPPSPPIPAPAMAWWNENQSLFSSGRRYQAGVSVSENPLGDHFDLFPDEVRYDLYLREKAVGSASVTDWEMETWPQYERDPGWGLRGQRYQNG
jgi:HEAT repeat protein